MLSIIKMLLSIAWAVLKVPIFVVCAFIVLFILSIALHIGIGYKQGRRFPRGTFRQPPKKRSAFIRLFWDLPKQIVNDMFNRNPDEFPYQGCVIFEGRQGYGKTISMIEYTMRMQEEYPDCKCLTNLNYLYEDEELNHWKKLIHYKNGPLGVIAIIDELQNWFSSLQSKNFPPEMLQVVTQQRKNRRIMLGTAQCFYTLAKSIRTQATEVRSCFTVLGCLTIVKRREPLLDSEGNVVQWKKRGMYFFVHNDKLRNAYDTYKVIESLSNSGFKEGADTLN